MSNFNRFVCWGDEHNIPVHQVINTEAVSVERALFLATHIPFNKIRYLSSPRTTNEQVLLQELLDRALKEQHSFTIVQGVAGTGKSHLIRWLKERYDAEGGNNDNVLLIERANSSLRQTLLQIVKSDVFDAKPFAEQIRRIESATQQLSDESLADTIINNLQVAAREVPVETQHPKESRLKKRVEPNLGQFLLNPSVREVLKRKGGAIDRLKEFLSGKRDGVGLGSREYPQFSADDFNFDMRVLDAIKRRGYAEEKLLAESLKLKKEVMREYVALYINQLLPFAIQRTTAISADDLKQLFLDLRRELKRQGQTLTLFIEDISVFTGLDAGLVDVLITQHTGEGGQEFCRITSVVGVTDAYYRDQFPDNIKERVTHRLTLNLADDEGSRQAQLLANTTDVADLYARYLNVLRMNSADFDAWERAGADPTSLPNACLKCQHRVTCHAAFGTRTLATQEQEHQVGLYPLNQSVIDTIHTHLNPQLSKTPRTMLVKLESLLGYRDDIRMGDFPPPARELLEDVTPPILREGDRYIREQAPRDAARIESLLAFWGDESINQTTTPSGETLIGQLPRPVFDAFDLPFINGIAQQYTNQKPSAPKAKISEKPLEEREQYKTKSIVQPLPSPIRKRVNPLIEQVKQWLRGESLKGYADFRNWIASFFLSAIDWEAHQLPYAMAKERLEGRRIQIEGQTTRQQGDSLTFKRTPELSYVLEAFVYLNKELEELSQVDIGSHFATLAFWLEQERERIVEFVREPASDTKSPVPLITVLVETNLMLAMLGEDLQPSKNTTRELCMAIIRQGEKFNPWSTLKSRSPYPHSAEWRDLMRGVERYVTSRKGDDCRYKFLQVVDKAQGVRGGQVLFVDSATVWDAVRQFKKREWEPTEIDLGDAKINNPFWTPSLNCHAKLSESFLEVVKQEQATFASHLVKVEMLVGDEDPKSVFKEIEQTLAVFDENGISSGRFPRDDKLTGQKLSNRLNQLQGFINKTKREDMILALSGGGKIAQELMSYTNYLQQFFALLESEQVKLDEQLADSAESANRNDGFQATVQEYKELLRLLGDGNEEVDE